MKKRQSYPTLSSSDVLSLHLSFIENPQNQFLCLSNTLSEKGTSYDIFEKCLTTLTDPTESTDGVSVHTRENGVSERGQCCGGASKKRNKLFCFGSLSFIVLFHKTTLEILHWWQR